MRKFEFAGFTKAVRDLYDRDGQFDVTERSMTERFVGLHGLRYELESIEIRLHGALLDRAIVERWTVGSRTWERVRGERVDDPLIRKPGRFLRWQEARRGKPLPCLPWNEL